MRFENRADAGRKLAAKLDAYRGTRPLILAIPRGGVPLGREVADALHGELDVVLVRKLGAPYNPEFAVGSVGESGKVIVADYAARVGGDEQYLAEEAARQLALIRKRRAQYASLHTSVSAKGRTVIVVDDGLATGATMRAALDEVGEEQHRYIRLCNYCSGLCMPEIAAMETADTGLPIHQTKNVLIPRASHNFEFFAEVCQQMNGKTYPVDDKMLNYTLVQPVGVCALVSPWNVPFMTATWKVAPCLALGNTAVLKMSELSPMTAARLGEQIQRVGRQNALIPE